MAMKNLSHKIYLAIPFNPMISDFYFTYDVSKMNEFEKCSYKGMRDTWNLLAIDGWEKQKNDPLLFPACASDHILYKFPNIVLF
jgi:hypothetical protein